MGEKNFYSAKERKVADDEGTEGGKRIKKGD